jgi:hypothetical protein
VVRLFTLGTSRKGGGIFQKSLFSPEGASGRIGSRVIAGDAVVTRAACPPFDRKYEGHDRNFRHELLRLDRLARNHLDLLQGVFTRGFFDGLGPILRISFGQYLQISLLSLIRVN